VCTRDRPNDLATLLQTVLYQDYLPLEVIIVDDSLQHSAEIVVNLFSSKFESAGCSLKYVSGSGDGLPAARNLGVKIANGDVLLFLDDDTLLSDKKTLKVIAEFFKKNGNALAVQPLITSPANSERKNGLVSKLENAIYKVLMLAYHKDDVLAVRRSGASIFPSNLTRVIKVQRLSGCCCCFRREIFRQFEFDTNLKRWGYMEDLDFSYRVYRKNPNSLYAIPYTKIVHKHTTEGRLTTKTTIYMSTIYWFYIFFKDIFEASILNLIAFMWALTGNLVSNLGGLIIKKKTKKEWWNLMYLLESYVIAFRNLRSILMQNLEFFNRGLK
jgi:GT2 family glycosyltransferase